jgi:hypothetical protein
MRGLFKHTPRHAADPVTGTAGTQTGSVSCDYRPRRRYPLFLAREPGGFDDLPELCAQDGLPPDRIRDVGLKKFHMQWRVLFFIFCMDSDAWILVFQ